MRRATITTTLAGVALLIPVAAQAASGSSQAARHDAGAARAGDWRGALPALRAPRRVEAEGVVRAVTEATATSDGMITVAGEHHRVSFTIPAGSRATGVAVGDRVEAHGVRPVGGGMPVLTRLELRDHEQGDDDGGHHGGDDHSGPGHDGGDDDGGGGGSDG